MFISCISCSKNNEEIIKTTFNENISSFEYWENEIGNINYEIVSIKSSKIKNEFVFQLGLNDSTLQFLLFTVYYDGKFESLQSEYVKKCTIEITICDREGLRRLHSFMFSNRIRSISKQSDEIQFIFDYGLMTNYIIKKNEQSSSEISKGSIELKVHWYLFTE